MAIANFLRPKLSNANYIDFILLFSPFFIILFKMKIRKKLSKTFYNVDKTKLIRHPFFANPSIDFTYNQIQTNFYNTTLYDYCSNLNIFSIIISKINAFNELKFI
jgi:hypothetical protein